MSETEICEILESPLVELNGANTAYGGGVSSFSLALGGISSQTKGSITLVGSNLTIPSVADDLEIKVMGLTLNLQVGGYNLQSSAAGAGQLQLNLYDNSNWYLDHNHIALKEEAPDSSKASNVHILGRKVGSIPNETLNKYGIRTANVDTLWGDIRDFYEGFTPFWAGGNEGWEATVDSYVAANAGKTIWHVKKNDDWDDKTLEEAFEDILAEGSDLVDGQFDFKGSFRDVISSYCSATSLQAWWDLEDDVLIIKRTKSDADGMEKLNKIKEKCRVLSSAESKDWTSTFTKGALGSITSSFQGENQQSSGYTMTRYFKAHLLKPTFHYKACRHKNEAGAGKFTVLDLENYEVRQAIRAAADPLIYGTYVTESMLATEGFLASAGAPAALPPLLPAVARGNFDGAANNLTVDQLTDTMDVDWYTNTLDNNGNPVDKKVGEKKNEDPITWTTEFNKKSPAGITYNSVLKDYYKPDAIAATAVLVGDEATSPARILPVKAAGDILKKAMLNVGGKCGDALKKGQLAKTGWNHGTDNFPYEACGEFCDGDFAKGNMFLLQTDWFGSVLGDDAVEAGDDLFRAYLLALYSFYQIFYVVKDGSGLVSARVKGAKNTNIDYGYYLTSEDQPSSAAPSVEGDFELCPMHPLVSLEDCPVGAIKDLATACAAMYLKKGAVWSDIIDQIAVIDFIHILEEGGRNRAAGPNTSLIKFFENVGAAADATPQRAVNVEDDDDPKLVMYLIKRTGDDIITGEDLANFFEDVTVVKRNKENQNIIAGDTKANDTRTACDGLIKRLPTGGSNADFIQYFFDHEQQTFTQAGGWVTATKPVELWAMGDFKGLGQTTLGGKIFPASMNEADTEVIKLTYKVDGTTNAIGSSPAEWTISAMYAPSKGNNYEYWSSKMDYGVSLNAADVGMENTAFQKWGATAANQGDPYSKSNKSSMRGALKNQVAEAAFSVSTPGKSTSLTVIVDKYDVELNPDLDLSPSEAEKAEAELLELPTMDEGLEALQISVSGGKTTLSLTVGNSLQKVAMKNIYDRMVQSPSSMYRPGSVIQESLLDTTPTFQIRQRGMAS